jgi:hypothetical protein
MDYHPRCHPAEIKPTNQINCAQFWVVVGKGGWLFLHSRLVLPDGKVFPRKFLELEWKLIGFQWISRSFTGKK